MKTKWVEIAAVHRLLQREGLNEGIDNHVSLGLGDGTFLLTPDRVHWEVLTASDIVRVDETGRVLKGRAPIDEITFLIHRAAQAARAIPRQTVTAQERNPNHPAVYESQIQEERINHLRVPNTRMRRNFRNSNSQNRSRGRSVVDVGEILAAP